MGNYTYNEIVNDAIDIYEDLLVRFKYSLPDTFYSWLNDFHLDEKRDRVELNTLMYVSFTCLLIAKQQDISFLLKDLHSIIEESELCLKIKKYLANDDDYLLFSRDLQMLLDRLASYYT